MNIFFLSMDATEAAQMQGNKHVIKMILETAQMLCTAHRVLDGDPKNKFKLPDAREDTFYKATHRNHPSAVWARTSIENYNWLVDHFEALLKEYTYRYDKRHASGRLLYDIQSPPKNLTAWDFTTPPSCMPDEYKIGDLVANYREYYRKAKTHLHQWKVREPPQWLHEIYERI